MTERLSECLIYAHSFPYVDDNCAEEESMQALGRGEQYNPHQYQYLPQSTTIYKNPCILTSLSPLQVNQLRCSHPFFWHPQAQHMHMRFQRRFALQQFNDWFRLSWHSMAAKTEFNIQSNPFPIDNETCSEVQILNYEPENFSNFKNSFLDGKLCSTAFIHLHLNKHLCKVLQMKFNLHFHCVLYNIVIL